MVINRSSPTATIVPILIYEDVGQAIEWLGRAFGFAERLRAERDGVIGHAQLAVAEGAIMLGRQGGPAGDEMPIAAKAPFVMVVKVPGPTSPEMLEWVEALDWKAYAQALRIHTDEHCAQVERTVAALGVER